MSVTQDYKVLTLTPAEVQAVQYALLDRINDLTQILLEARDDEVIQRSLKDAQAAYAKVRA